MSNDQANDREVEITAALKIAGVNDLAISTDERTGASSVLANPGAARGEDILKRLPVGFTANPDISYEWTTARVTVPEAPVRGGGRMDDSQTDSAVCTTGFTVKEASTGRTGVVSAGHCTNTGLKYWFTSTYGETLYHKGDYVAYLGDYGWYTVYGIEYPEFYAHHSQVRAYTGSAYAGNGMTICNYGRRSDRNYVLCADVVDDSANTSFSPVMVRMNKDITIGGDSGGPWYAYNTGYGIHFGDISGTSSFSQVHYVDDALGINTLKS